MTDTTKHKQKQKTNEGHEAPVPMGRSVGLVFIIGLVVGGLVTFFAVAGRTQGVIEQRRELRQQQLEKAGTTSDAMAPAPTETEPTAP